MPAATVRRPGSRPLTAAESIVTGALLCGVLDGLAAFAQAWLNAGRTPSTVLKGIASAVFGRAALEGGAAMVATGLVLHFSVALTATVVFFLLSRRFAFLRDAPLWLIGPLYGVVVLAAMNYGTIPLASLGRSFYFGTPVRWSGGMGWPMVAIHMTCVGPPIVWSVRRAVIDSLSASSLTRAPRGD